MPKTFQQTKVGKSRTLQHPRKVGTIIPPDTKDQRGGGGGGGEWGGGGGSEFIGNQSIFFDMYKSIGQIFFTGHIRHTFCSSYIISQ